MVKRWSIPKGRVRNGAADASDGSEEDTAHSIDSVVYDAKGFEHDRIHTAASGSVGAPEVLLWIV